MIMLLLFLQAGNIEHRINWADTIQSGAK